MVDEHPQRIGYVDTLNHLGRSDAVLVLGSTEAHYTPSKVFQAMLSRRPVLALLHEESSAVGMVRRSRAGTVLALTESRLPIPGEVAQGIEDIMAGVDYDPRGVEASTFEAWSARASTRALAEALDLAVERSGGR